MRCLVAALLALVLLAAGPQSTAGERLGWIWGAGARASRTPPRAAPPHFPLIPPTAPCAAAGYGSYGYAAAGSARRLSGESTRVGLALGSGLGGACARARSPCGVAARPCPLPPITLPPPPSTPPLTPPTHPSHSLWRLWLQRRGAQADVLWRGERGLVGRGRGATCGRRRTPGPPHTPHPSASLASLPPNSQYGYARSLLEMPEGAFPSNSGRGLQSYGSYGYGRRLTGARTHARGGGGQAGGGRGGRREGGAARGRWRSVQSWRG